MTPEDEQPVAPHTSAKGKKRAEEKFKRQAAALRANLRRRTQQRRGQEGDQPDGGESDTE